MATNQAADYYLNNLPFMLVRGEQGHQGRSWRRTGVPDIPPRLFSAIRTQYGNTYGNEQETLDHPEVWEDWSGGFGDAYRHPDRPNAVHWMRGFDLRFPRQAIHSQAPQVLPARYASVNLNADFFIDVPLPGVAAPPAGAGAVLALGRGYVASFTPTQYPNTAGSAFDLLYEATGGGAINFGHRPALFGSWTYLPNTDGSSFYQRGHDGTTYTLGPNQTARWFSVAAGRMWFPFSRNMVRSVPIFADPLVTGNYAATLVLGNGFSQTQDALALENQLYVSFPEGVYQGNLSGTFANMFADVGDSIDVDNARDLTTFQGGIVSAAGPHLYWFHPGQTNELREIGPTAITSNRSAIRGRFTCVKGYGKLLYAGLFTGSGSWFLAGRDASPGLPYVWHPLHDFLGLVCKVSRIHVDGISSSSGGTRIPNRIWCATEATFGAQAGATAPMFWWPIPAGDGSPISDASFSPNYMGSAQMDLGYDNWGSPVTSKVWRVGEVRADSLLSGYQYSDLYFSVDGGVRTLVGRGQDSPRSLLYFTAVQGAFVQGQSMELSVESFTATRSITPIYRTILSRGVLRPNSIDTIEALTHIGDRVPDRRGNQLRPGMVQLADLRSIAKGSAPALLTDLTGGAAWVSVLAPIEETEFYQQGSEIPEVQAMVRMSVLEFTTASPIVGGAQIIGV